MATKNVYLGDDQGNEIYPYVPAANIIDAGQLTKDYALKKDVLNVNAGVLGNGTNFDEVDKPGFFQILGADITTMQNYPSIYTDTNLYATVLNIGGAGLHQYWLQGEAIVSRARIGNPEKWTAWKLVNSETIDLLKVQTAFLAKQVAGMQKGAN